MGLPKVSVSADQRLFFALWPDPQTRDKLVAIQRATQAPSGVALHPDDLHLTLAFLGQVSSAQSAGVKAVADAMRPTTINLSIDHLGHWPQPRVIWAGPTQVPPALTELVAALWGGLEACGFQPETRPYRPHITLYRKAKALLSAATPRPLVWQPVDFVLACSLSGPGLPRYKVLQRWPLKISGSQG